MGEKSRSSDFVSTRARPTVSCSGATISHVTTVLVGGVAVADSDARRARRYRLHRDGDHSLCVADRCSAAGLREPAPDGSTQRLRAAIRAEFPAEDEMSLALAERLADLSAGKGAAAVQALRALGELVAAQRSPL
jgi:hypothetical protein